MSTELLTHSAVYTVRFIYLFLLLFFFLSDISLKTDSLPFQVALEVWAGAVGVPAVAARLSAAPIFALVKKTKLKFDEHNHKSEAWNTPLPQLSLFCVLEEFAVGMIREEEHTSTAAPGTSSIGSEHMRICAPEVIKEVSL